MAGTNLQKESVSALDGARNKSHTGLQEENLVPEVLRVPGAGQFSAHPPPALAMPLWICGGLRPSDVRVWVWSKACANQRQ